MVDSSDSQPPPERLTRQLGVVSLTALLVGITIGSGIFRVPSTVAAQIGSVGGMAISKGAAVRLHPNRRADSMDMFLAGRTATVEAVFESVDEDLHVAVTIDDDPATDLHRASGRFFYFAPDELEPISPAEPAAGSGPVILEPSARSLVER